MDDDASIAVVHTASGAKALVHPVGATVVSFVTAGSAGREVLYTSPQALFDGSKAIRGGVPIVFPQCRQPDPSMPNHGFMRINRWRVGKKTVDDESRTVQEFHLNLQDVKKGRGGSVWGRDASGFDFEAIYQVEVQAESFTTKLTITNTGSKSFPFQLLYHTYYRVAKSLAHDREECYVDGLDGYECVNQDTNNESVMKANRFHLDGHTDSIFSPSLNQPDLTLDVATGNKTGLAITATGAINGEKLLPVSVCVWNPHVQESLALKDFPDDGYHDMIGVEPGLLDNQLELECGKQLVFSVTTVAK